MKTLKTIKALSAITILCLLFAIPAIAGKTVSFTASCYMPSYADISDNEAVSIKTTSEEQSQITQKDTQETKDRFIEQQEIIKSEDGTKTEFITTVCAK